MLMLMLMLISVCPGKTMLMLISQVPGANEKVWGSSVQGGWGRWAGAYCSMNAQWALLINYTLRIKHTISPFLETSFWKKLWQMSAQFSPNGFQIDFCRNWCWIYFLLNGADCKNYISQWGLLRCNRTIKPPTKSLQRGNVAMEIFVDLFRNWMFVYHVRTSMSIKKEQLN